MNRVTKERISLINARVKSELIAFQINPKEIKETVDGCLDLPLFSIRFRFVIAPDPRDDLGFDEVILIPEVEDIDSMKIFWALYKKGYMHYLRKRISFPAYTHFLERKDLWQNILKAVIEEDKSPYKIYYCKALLKLPLLQILSEDHAAFDWLLR